MSIILAHAQGLVYTLLSLMPSHYQRDSLQAILGLFLQAQGHPLPQQSQVKSASALSRFLNVYPWSTRRLIRATREIVLKQVLSQRRKGRKPILQVIIDLTSLEKRGKVKSCGALKFLSPSQADGALRNLPFGTHSRCVHERDKPRGMYP